MLSKNVAGQGIYIYAHDTLADAAKLGDAANITATISIDGDTTPSAIADTNPDEIGGGVYWFNLSQAESNGDALAIIPVSTTPNVQIDPLIILTDGGLTATERNAIANALLDLTDGIETDYTLRQSQRIILASAAAKLSGAATTNVLIRDINDTKNRINATVDANGNRTVVVLDVT